MRKLLIYFERRTQEFPCPAAMKQVNTLHVCLIPEGIEVKLKYIKVSL